MDMPFPSPKVLRDCLTNERTERILRAVGAVRARFSGVPCECDVAEYGHDRSFSIELSDTEAAEVVRLVKDAVVAAGWGPVEVTYHANWWRQYPVVKIRAAATEADADMRAG